MQVEQDLSVNIYNGISLGHRECGLLMSVSVIAHNRAVPLFLWVFWRVKGGWVGLGAEVLRLGSDVCLDVGHDGLSCTQACLT